MGRSISKYKQIVKMILKNSNKNQDIIRNESIHDLKLPTSKQEKWRLTNLKRLKSLRELPIETKIVSTNIPEKIKDVCRIYLDEISDPLEGIFLPKGISILNSDELSALQGTKLKSCKCQNEWSVRFNRAFISQILALRITGNPPPLELICRVNSASIRFTRVILVLEKNARLELLQVFRGQSGGAQNNIIELQIGEGAQLDHGVIAFGDGSSSLLTLLAAEQELKSKYYFSNIVSGWKFGRLEPYVVQRDGAACTSINGLCLTRGNEQFATHTSMRFEGPKGEFNQLQKCFADDSSHTIFNGAVSVPRLAQHTVASQMSRNLLLSKKARIDTKPELEIVADDVKCTHGATISQLKEDQLFYLRSRGVDGDEASALVLKGAFKEIIDKLPPLAGRWNPLHSIFEGYLK